MIDQLTQIGIKEGIFALLFIWLLIDTKKESKAREDKLYNFLDGMKEEFSKLVHNYESLSSDVEDIKNDIKFKQNKGD